MGHTDVGLQPNANLTLLQIIMAENRNFSITFSGGSPRRMLKNPVKRVMEYREKCIYGFIKDQYSWNFELHNNVF
jgi:hypothetical protein